MEWQKTILFCRAIQSYQTFELIIPVTFMKLFPIGLDAHASQTAVTPQPSHKSG